jgi:hypothetical protein
LDGKERLLGLSWCQPDTDGDGCDDLAEFELGGCDASHSMAKLCNDNPEPPELGVKLNVLNDAERLEPRLEIIKLGNEFDPAWIDAVKPSDVSPPGAGTVEAGGFSNVKTNATLGVVVKLALTPNLSLNSPWSLMAVRAYTPSGTLSGEALLLIVIGRCERPIPI